ncbi:MAG: hypothetical protein K2K64_10885 [Muribaculaceae bacterium]|nr:hypothetical protein [Muribaculaceae bacterium]
MKRLILSLIAVLWLAAAYPEKFTYNFKTMSLSEALSLIAEEHPQLKLNFIYNDLDNYNVSGRIDTEDGYTALKQLIGLNPVSVIKKGNHIYVEALQHGKFRYYGNVVGNNAEPVVAATVLILAPKDSTVITYGITDNDGRFSIPCDQKDVIGKLSCVGYKTTYRKFNNFNVGSIKMSENPVLLKNVNVTADDARLYSDKSVYLPSTRQKNASTDATDLLRLMAIPQININPINGDVSDNGGRKVAIFINNSEASKEEIQGLRTQDVRKVEYLEFPTDPRFRNEERVINFIVQEYFYGGYTKIGTTDIFLAGFSNRSTIYSKFSFKKWTYDLFLASDNIDNHHTGKSIDASYSLNDAQNNPYTLRRKDELESSHFKQNQFPITFQVSYNSDKIQVRNTVGFTHNNKVADNERGKLYYTPSNGNDFSYSRMNPSINNSIAYNGMLYLSLPKNLSINITPKFSYARNNDEYRYGASSLPSPIERFARENAYYYRVDANITKQINSNHSLSLGANGGEWINKLTYKGSDNYYDSFHLGFVAALINYNFRKNNVNLNTRIGVCLEPSRINTIKDNVTYPFASINFGYSPDSRNSFSANVELSTSSPTINLKASDILQQNEYMYVGGNPYLKSSPMLGTFLSYTFIPRSNLTLSLFGYLMESFDRIIVSYEQYNDGQAILRNLNNDGDKTTGQIGASASMNLLNHSLQIHVNPKLSFYKSTGIYKKSSLPLSLNLQATYYLSKFYLKIYYQSPQKGIYTMYPGTYSYPQFYSATIGWANSNWNVRFHASNFFSRKWIKETSIIESKWYSSHTTNFSPDYHSQIGVTATYTFGYGKKMAQGYEIGEQGSPSSAIIK